MKPRSLRIALLGLLVATLLAAFFAPPQSDAVSQPSKRPSPRTADAVPASAPSSLRAQRSDSLEVLTLRPRDDEDGDPPDTFARPPAPAPVPAANAIRAAAPAPQASAPPVPFRVLGRFQNAGQTGVFIELGDQNLIVHVGDTISGQYKVEAIDDDRLTVRYLPLGQQQIVAFFAPPQK